jgi:hypothetical protein
MRLNKQPNTKKAGPGRLPASPAAAPTVRFPGYSSKSPNGANLPEKRKKIFSGAFAENFTNYVEIRRIRSPRFITRLASPIPNAAVKPKYVTP